MAHTHGTVITEAQARGWLLTIALAMLLALAGAQFAVGGWSMNPWVVVAAAAGWLVGWFSRGFYLRLMAGAQGGRGPGR